MTIETLAKVSLIGPQGELEAALKALQGIGLVHLIAPPGRSVAEPGTLPPRVVRIDEAIRYLKDVALPRQPAPADRMADPGELIDRVLANRQRRRAALDRIEHLREMIGQLAPWGEFGWPDSGALGGLQLWLYRLPVSERARLEQLEAAWQEVNRDGRYSYVAVVEQEPRSANVLNVQPLTIARARLSGLRAEIADLHREMEDLDAERVAMTRWLLALERERDELEDAAHLLDTCEAFAAQGPFFRIRGWVPRRRLDELAEFADQNGVLLTEELVEPEEEPPTLLSNGPEARSGQQMLAFFSTPGYRTWDPSALVLWSFVLFFSMILADAGYALVLAGITAYFYRRMGAHDGLKQFRKLCVLLCLGSFVYGLLTGSYFGVAPEAGSLLAAIAVVDLNDYTRMMQLSVLIGAAHLLIAMAAAARQMDRWGRLRSAGWLLVTVGGVAAWLGASELRDAFLMVLAAGLLLVLIGGDDTRIVSFSTLLRRIGRGLLEMRQVTRLFGDVLSYLRLFALGLASSSLAVVFNDMAVRAADGVAGIGLLLAIVISFFGHGINLTLAVVGGFIHGLRLNFIEFLSWGISSEGYRFTPFKKKGGPTWETA